MNLSEFIKKRLEEMGRNKSWLVNFNDMDWSTFTRINKGLPISKATQEKLAKALECSQGDIQACIAEQNPLQNVIVNKKSLAKLNAKKEASAPDPKDEEPAEVFQLDESNVDMMFPPEPEPTAEQLEEKTEKLTNELMDMAIKAYQLKLKDKVGKILASTHHELTDAVRQEIGVMLLQELWGENE